MEAYGWNHSTGEMAARDAVGMRTTWATGRTCRERKKLREKWRKRRGRKEGMVEKQMKGKREGGTEGGEILFASFFIT